MNSRRALLAFMGITLLFSPLAAQTLPLYGGASTDDILQAIDNAVARNDKSPALAKQLIEAVNNEGLDLHIRERAAWALGQLEIRSGVPALLKAVKSKGLIIRSAALNALVHLSAPQALPVLVDIAKNDLILSMRERATVALGLLRTDKALKPLVALSSDPREEIRGASALGMGALQSQKNDFRKILGEMAAEPSTYVQQCATRALEVANRNSKAVQHQLDASDTANNGNVRLFAALYFQQFGKATDLKAVKDAANVESDDDVRVELKKAVKAIEKKIAVEKKKRRTRTKGTAEKAASK